jgi:hypothetical protein
MTRKLCLPLRQARALGAHLNQPHTDLKHFAGYHTALLARRNAPEKDFLLILLIVEPLRSDSLIRASKDALVTSPHVQRLTPARSAHAILPM